MHLRFSYRKFNTFPKIHAPAFRLDPYKRFTDAGGAEIYTYVRNYAGFAGEEVPAGKSCSLTGILQYDDAGKGRYLLKLRDENDCMY